MRNRAVAGFVCGLVTLGMTASLGSQEKGKTPAMQAAFDQFKTLTGDWVMTGKDGKPGDKATHSYRVTAAGSAVIETMFADTDHEMVTVYHLDGDDLMLTHYCAAQNQPRMKAVRNGDTKKVVFQFAGITNLKSPKDLHIHDAVFHFIDDQHIKSEWTHHQDGKPGGTMTMNLVRLKK